MYRNKTLNCNVHCLYLFFSLHVLQLYIFFLFGDVSTYNINFGIRERKIEIGKNFKVIWVNYFCSMFFHVFSCFYIFLTFYVQCLNRNNFNYFQCSNELHKIMILYFQGIIISPTFYWYLFIPSGGGFRKGEKLWVFCGNINLFNYSL